LENDINDESNAEALSTTPTLVGNHDSSQGTDVLPDVSQTESVDIFMEASESLHEEPSMINTKLASKLRYNINFSPICEVNYDFMQYASTSIWMKILC
jgi:hypothetical protein